MSHMDSIDSKSKRMENNNKEKFKKIRVYKDDGLPTVMCHRCSLRLNSAHRFKQQAVASDEVFRAEIPHLQLTEDDLPIVDVQDIKLLCSVVLDPNGRNVAGNVSREEVVELPVAIFVDGTVGNMMTPEDKDKKEGNLVLDKIDYVQPANNLVNLELATEANYAVNFIKEEVCDEPGFDLLLCEAVYSENQPEDGSSHATGIVHKERNVTENSVTSKSVLTGNRRKCQHVIRKELESDEVTENVSATFRQTREPTRKVIVTIPNKLRVSTAEERNAKRRLAKQLKREELRMNNGGRLPKPPSKPCVCHICGKTYLGMSNLAQHILFHRNERHFKCTNCNRAYNSKKHLRRHTLAQSCANLDLLNGEGAFQCPECKKTFSIKLALTSHMKSHIDKTTSQPQACNVCGKVFIGHTNLRQHLIVHRTERPYKCTACDRCFKRRGHLNRHMVFHTGEKTHQCITCGKCFGRYSLLKSHMTAHTEVRPFKCLVPDCGRSYKQRSGYERHAKLHLGIKPHRCDECDASFLQHVHLRRHKRIHTGERPYVCMLCSKTFGRKHHLKAHMRMHTGERSFICDICQKSFVHKVSLIGHLKKYHNF